MYSKKPFEGLGRDPFEYFVQLEYKVHSVKINQPYKIQLEMQHEEKGMQERQFSVVTKLFKYYVIKK